MMLAIDGKLAGILTVADAPKPHARLAIEALKAVKIRPIMLTGDNRRTAEAIAAQLGMGAFSILVSRTAAVTSPEESLLAVWWA